MRKKGVCKLSIDLYERFHKVLNRKQELRNIKMKYDYPHIYLLGSIGGIIVRAISIQVNNECPEFPNIDTESLTKAYLRLFKEGFEHVGIARVGLDIVDRYRWYSSGEIYRFGGTQIGGS